jgi:probable F420-dependent oxidoreductase
MQFGTCLPNFPFGVQPSREAILEVAQEAEQSGFDSVWVSDHILVPADKPRYGNLFEALSTLTYVGAKTEKIKLGTSIMVLPYRNAVTVAKQTATIDALTEGRLILGVGAGWIEGEFESVGADFHARGRRLDAGLKVLKELWTSDDPQVDDEFYQFSDVLFEPKPHRPEGIPIWVGGHSKAALRRTVQFGNAWHADDLPHEELASYMETLKEMGNGREVAVTLRRTVDLRPALAMAREGTGEAGGVAGGRWPGGSAAALTGTLDEVRAEIDALARLGVEHFVCQFEHETQQEHLDQIQLFGSEIISSYR